MHFTKPDLHMHSTFSDGDDEPQRLIALVRNTGCDIFALTDHDCFEGGDLIASALMPGDPAFIRGIEFSCRDVGFKSHILGYLPKSGCKYTSEAVAFTSEERKKKVRYRLDALVQQHGFDLSEEEKEEILSLRNPGKPHIVKRMLERGFIKDKEEGFALFRGLDTPRTAAITSAEAIDVIRKDGGIPVLAHGFLGDGSKKLTENELEERVRYMKEKGLMGLEAYYSAFTPQQVSSSLEIAKKYGLLVTTGSDYHGEGRHDTFIGNTNNPSPEILAPFYEAAKELIFFP